MSAGYIQYLLVVLCELYYLLTIKRACSLFLMDCRENARITYILSLFTKKVATFKPKKPEGKYGFGGTVASYRLNSMLRIIITVLVKEVNTSQLKYVAAHKHKVIDDSLGWMVQDGACAHLTNEFR